MIMVARFDQPKDHRLLLHACRRIGHLSWELILVGDGPLRDEAQDTARELGLAERVAFLGDRDDVPSLLSEADVFVLASRWEGLPICILEAMRAELPVVATAVGGVPELIEHGRSGWLVPPGDVSGMAQALACYVVDSAKGREHGARSRAILEERFTERKMIERIERVYGLCVARPIHAPPPIHIPHYLGTRGVEE